MIHFDSISSTIFCFKSFLQQESFLNKALQASICKLATHRIDLTHRLDLDKQNTISLLTIRIRELTTNKETIFKNNSTIHEFAKCSYLVTITLTGFIF